MKRFLLLPILLLSHSANSETFWSDFSVSYLQGSNYEVGDNKRKVVTFEHAAGTSWGDSFFFMDRLESNNGDGETYAEFSPRFKVMNMKTAGGVMENLYIATTIEYDTFSSTNFSNSFTNYLVGVGTNLHIKYFDYAKVNFYARNNDQSDNNAQMTFVWGLPLGPLYYDGFIDWTTSTDDAESSFNMTSQLKYDLAPHFNMKKSKLFVGIEYAYWLNKFGIDGVDENNVNLLVKYHF